jgi:histidine ammonia-lyase
MQMVSTSDVVAALTLEGCAAHLDPLAAAHHEDARPHPGQLQSVSNLRTLLKCSQLIGRSQSPLFILPVPTHGVGHSGRTAPDPMSIRCVPQYHGPARDLIANVARSLTIELNSAQPA